MSWSDLVEWMRGRASDALYRVPLPSAPPDSEPFVAGDVYLEVRLQQLWLANKRQWTREFQPVATVVTRFLRRGEPVTVPAVLGPTALAEKIEAAAGTDQAEVTDVRIAGPTPYEGDDVSLLMALFRAQTVDWLARSVSVLEDVAGAVGAAGLAAAAPVAAPIVRGLSRLVGAQELEFRLGEHRSWTSDTLRPMSYVIMGRPPDSVIRHGARGLSVIDGRLSSWDDGTGRWQPYREQDFMVVQLAARRLREDYRRLEFYRLWQRTQEHLRDDELDAALRTWRRTVGALHSDELTEHQQDLLFAEYQRRFTKQQQRLDQLRQPGRPEPFKIDDADPADILRNA